MMNGSDIVDLTEVIPLEQVEHEMTTPNGKPTGWKITLNDISHPKAQAWAKEQRAQNLAKERQRDLAQARGRGSLVPEEKTPEQALDHDVRWVVSRIVTWTPVKIPFIRNGDALHYSDSVAVEVLKHPKMTWALNQIVRVITDDESFMRSSAKKSDGLPSDGSSSQPSETTE